MLDLCEAIHLQAFQIFPSANCVLKISQVLLLNTYQFFMTRVKLQFLKIEMCSS